MNKKQMNLLTVAVFGVMLLISIGFVLLRFDRPGFLDLSRKSPQLGSVEEDNNIKSLRSAIVVIRSASGSSYMADRTAIATMPELGDQGQIRDFISRYTPCPDEKQSVISFLKESGFTIDSYDDFFIKVSGENTAFDRIISSHNQDTMLSDDGGFFTNHDLVVLSEEIDYIDGLVVFAEIPEPVESLSVAYKSRQRIQTPVILGDGTYYTATYPEMLKALKFNRVHPQGLRGTGVNIGIIDHGVYAGHPFFFEYPFDMRFYRYVDGKVTRVGNNFIYGTNPYDNSIESHTNHGTAVASFLAATSPGARLHSFAKPTHIWVEPPETWADEWFLGYLTYLNQQDLVDVLSISYGWWEEDYDFTMHLPEIRTALINLISKNTIVLIAAGNAGQCYEGLCSGYNALAAIPEVIAVGGSELVPVGNSFLFDASKRGSSFESTLYPGRAVPDIVGIYGNFLVPDIDQLFSLGGGTSYATPQIAGMVALLKQQNPELNQAQVRTILTNNTFDITEGENFDGIPAGPGYDLPTGHGQPLAHWVTSQTMTLYNGWNLIGLTRDYDYSAKSMLIDINSQGGRCDSVIQWVKEKQSYEGIVYFDDSLFGFDFDTDPGVGYWVRCDGKSFWTQQGSHYFTQEIPIEFVHGWNLISIPYSSAPCRTGQLNRDTNDLCWRIVEYDGQLNEFHSRFRQYGDNFTLSPGKGYLVLCDGHVNWTPTCLEQENSDFHRTTPKEQNIFQPGQLINPKHANAIEAGGVIRIDSNLLNAMAERWSGELYFWDRDEQLVDPLTKRSHSCTPADIRVTNVSDQTFSVSWRTLQPCTGSLLVSQGDGSFFEAYDDRGKQYSGLTHHVTVFGLSAETNYSVIILSGEELFEFTSVRTGKYLSTIRSNQLVAIGSVLDNRSDHFDDSIVYARLRNESDNSSWISFPYGSATDGFSLSLGNMLTMANDNPYPYASAQELEIFVEGGILYDSFRVNVNLTDNAEVLIPDVQLGNIPSSPTLIGPINTFETLTPIFKMVTQGTGSQQLKYRLEMSHDNFSSIEHVFDQTVSDVGWSASAYLPGQVAQFAMPIPLEDFVGYQWRAFAYDTTSNTWSSVSNMASFSVKVGSLSVGEYQVFLPVVIH